MIFKSTPKPAQKTAQPAARKTVRQAVAALAFVALGAWGMAQFGFGGRNFFQSDKILETPDGKAFVETYNALRENHLRDPKSSTLIQGALTGMLASLDDEFTYFIAPSAATTQREDLKGEFFGIGVGIMPLNKDGTGVQIETVFRGAPASVAGLEPGDVILAVNGKDITKMPLDEAVRLIRGPKGSAVNLKVLRGRNTLNIKVVRDRIPLINASTTVLPGNIGYLAITDFANEKLGDQVAKALEGLRGKNTKGLILDLRNNPGGLVNQATSVADQFMASGDIFVTRDKAKRVRVEYAASKNRNDYLGPLVVLVNSSSASASEIVAAALQETKRAKIVGEKTYGKGVANIPTPLSNNGQVNVAFEEWLTPKRNSIYKRGITPDAIVTDTRYPKLLTIEGLNAAPGSTVEVKINGKNLKLTADKTGRFQYQAEATRVRNDDRQGTALVDLKTDAQVRKALELLK